MDKEVRMPLKNSIYCFLAALIWGVAFVAQSKGMDYLGPFSFNGGRTLLGALVLLPFVIIRKRKPSRENLLESSIESSPKKQGTSLKLRLIGGLCCGLALCVASSFQQIGIKYTTVGKAGFITALYIVIVPVFGIFLKKKVPVKVWAAAVIAVAGLYMICMNESFSLTMGDAFVLLCAPVFAIHILLIDYFSPKMDSIELSFIQFIVVAIISLSLGIITEKPSISDFAAAIGPLAYSGILSCGVAYTLQILGQKNADPTISSLILSLESVISVIAGWLILHQSLSIRELVGCIIVFAAILLVQLPGFKGKNKGMKEDAHTS